jgi:hypothetical protein
VDFVNRRLKEDINLLPRLAACKCAEEVANIYAEFWRNLGEDYTNEFGVLAKLSGDLATTAATTGGPKPRSCGRRWIAPHSSGYELAAASPRGQLKLEPQRIAGLQLLSGVRLSGSDAVALTPLSPWCQTRRV